MTYHSWNQICQIIFSPNIQWEVGGCHFTSCLSTGQRIFPYHHDFLTGGVCTTGMHYMRDVTIFTRNNRPNHHGPIQGLDGNDIPYPQSSPFCPFFFFQIRTLFSIFIIYPLPSFSPTFSNFLSSSLFVKIFSIFWSDQLFNPTSLNFSFFIFQIFEYTLHNEVTREFSSFFFLRTLIKVKNPGQ